jgi:sulfopyruvate decarboxylase subunit beta
MMPAKEALVVIHEARGEEDVVITTMTPARDWMTLSQNPRDLVLVPSAMGHATSMGLGLALAQPERRVIVCNGDGSMLMNLGSLVSIAEARAGNMIVLVFDNGTYEVTGSQRVPGAGAVDFAALARGAGWHSVFEFSDLDDWRRHCDAIYAAGGPTFVWLHIEPVYGLPGPRSPGPAAARAKQFMAAIRSESLRIVGD